MARTKKASRTTKKQSTIMQVAQENATKRTSTIGALRDKSLVMADIMFQEFVESGDLKLAQLANSQFKTAITSAKVELMHQKQTGTSKIIPFCDGE